MDDYQYVPEVVVPVEVVAEVVIEPEVKSKKKKEEVKEPEMSKKSEYCKSCGSDNIFEEVVNSKEWRHGREYDISYTNCTCVACGNNWKKK